MNTWTRAVPIPLLCGAVVMLSACSPEPDRQDSGAGGPEITNRLDVPPDVVNNLGITFEVATRGRLGIWRQVPGQLEVPEHSRWVLRAPVRSRVVSVVPRWQAVEKGDVLATLTSPDVPRLQGGIELAERTLERATREVAAARARLAESEAHLGEARSFERATRERLGELQALAGQGNPLTARERIEARRHVTEAGKARLDAAIARDDLVSRVETRQLEADQARLAVTEKLRSLAMVTGIPVDELRRSTDRGPAWRRIDDVTLRAPAAGVVVELLAAQGEVLDAGAPVVHLYDTGDLRFRGHLPEGDVGMLAAGDPVRLEFPARSLPPVETRLEAPIPVADTDTRMVHVEAVVPGTGDGLAHGLSVTAHVRVEESEREEVLVPRRCVVFDGLEAIVFKRDPEDPNVVIRQPVELGARAADRVEVLAGLLDGDEVVADGVHQLKQTGLGKAPEGGHFHADGTWHSDHG